MNAISTALRNWQDLFNEARSLVEIGRKIILVSDLLPEEERKDVQQHYIDGDLTWLKIWIKYKEKENDRQSKKANTDRVAPESSSRS